MARAAAAIDVRRTVPKPCGSLVWSITSTNPSVVGQMLRVSMPLIFMAPIWPFRGANYSPHASPDLRGRRLGGLDGRTLREHLQPRRETRIALTPAILGNAQIEIADGA